MRPLCIFWDMKISSELFRICRFLSLFFFDYMILISTQMSAAALSKADYLKKYLSGGGSSDGTSTKKKKSKKTKPLGAG